MSLQQTACLLAQLRKEQEEAEQQANQERDQKPKSRYLIQQQRMREFSTSRMSRNRDTKAYLLSDQDIIQERRFNRKQAREEFEKTVAKTELERSIVREQVQAAQEQNRQQKVLLAEQQGRYAEELNRYEGARNVFKERDDVQQMQRTVIKYRARVLDHVDQHMTKKIAEKQMQLTHEQTILEQAKKTNDRRILEVQTRLINIFNDFKRWMKDADKVEAEVKQKIALIDSIKMETMLMNDSIDLLERRMLSFQRQNDSLLTEIPERTTEPKQTNGSSAQVEETMMTAIDMGEVRMPIKRPEPSVRTLRDNQDKVYKVPADVAQIVLMLERHVKTELADVQDPERISELLHHSDVILTLKEALLVEERLLFTRKVAQLQKLEMLRLAQK